MFFAAAAAALAGCGYYGNDEGVRYLQRKDTVTLSAGDASQANAVAQTIHPWPPGVGNRYIPMEGSRAVRAVECYRQAGGQQATPGTERQSTTNISSSSGTSGSATAGGGATTQLRC